MKINKKLILFNMILPVLLVAAILSVLHIVNIIEIKEDSQDELLILSDYVSSRFEQILVEKVQYLENLSRQASTVNLYYSAENTFDIDFWESNPDYIRFTEEFAQGEHFEKDVDETFAAYKGIDPALSNTWLKIPKQFKSNERTWFVGVMARNNYFITEPYAYSNLDNRRIGISISYPIYRKGVKKGLQQDIIGAVGLDFNMDNINTLASELEKELNMKIGLYDRSGKILYDSNYEYLRTSKSLNSKINELTFWDLYSLADNTYTKEKGKNLFARYKRGRGKIQDSFMGEEILGAHRELADGFWIIVIYKPAVEITAKATRDAILRSLLIGISLILVLLFSTLFLKFSVVSSLIRTSSALDQIAQGDADLTVKLHVHSNDEVGQLGQSFNTFLLKLKDLILDVQKVIVQTENIESEISIATSESSSSVEQSSQILSSMGKEVLHLDNGITQTVASIEEITANINSMDFQINDQAAMVEESTAAITQMIASLNNVDSITHTKQMATADLAKSAEQGRKQVEETSEAFHEMVSYIGSIQEMADVINAISSQTNLLSMNAAIEAAHAGDSGKGFAVVAEEIRKLAETSAESSQQISNLVANITETVKKTDENVTATSNIFMTINKEVKDTIDAFSEIQQSIKELNTGGQQVLDASERINNVTVEIRNGSSEIKGGTSIILKSSEDIKNASSRVHKGMQEVNSGNGEILKAMQNLVGLVSELNTIVTALKKEFGAFKTS